ncbi:acyl carrier protein phosphodiesterase [Vibrio sinaloensis]|uniref:acyl carrier protein phosphodiesterase n=1 Tax=Photobacterium sp. (strain ATCC 43367) TaxID=379097 RepID=UPI000586A147|nr:ACP phosphodiesterase [Vibrio sinaloensis]
MNFLAHLHIAQHCQSSLLGNLLGDFVKGNPHEQYDDDIAQGIKLHRFVDSFTDSHSFVQESRALFTDGHRRFSGIALDMFWDHCLARHWQNYHRDSLENFCQYAQQQVNQPKISLPARFERVNALMWQGKWLESYQDMDNIEFALQRMSQRSPRMEKLNQCIPYLNRHYDELTEVFARFYPEVLNASKRF